MILVRQHEKYQNKDITIDMPGEHGGGHGNHIHLSIDNRDIHVMSSPVENIHHIIYHTRNLPLYSNWLKL
jgi:hypothetical protein